jgi:TM2 domain-containing membrane protein YozV
VSGYAIERPTKYCQSCGVVIDARSVVCPKCGVMQPMPPGMDESEKKLLPAVILCATFGVFGGHRFYAGKHATGVLQLLTLGGFGVWTAIDFIRLVVGSFKDAEGNRISEWV